MLSEFPPLIMPESRLHMAFSLSFDKMPFLNQYKAPRALPVSNYHSDTPLQEYDLNFCYPIPRQLQSSGVKLVPLIVRPPSLSFTFVPSSRELTINEWVAFVAWRAIIRIAQTVSRQFQVVTLRSLRCRRRTLDLVRDQSSPRPWNLVVHRVRPLAPIR